VLVDRSAPRPTPVPGGAPAMLTAPPLGGAQARARADFPLLLPTWLPAGLPPLTCYDPQPPPSPDLPHEDVFGCSTHVGNRAFLGLQEVKMRPGAPVGGMVVSAAAATPVTVRGQAGLYAAGSWNDDGTWNPHLDYAYLTWKAGDITYTLVTHGLHLGRAELLRVADGLR
jgi:hypothetical protein